MPLIDHDSVAPVQMFSGVARRTRSLSLYFCVARRTFFFAFSNAAASKPAWSIFCPSASLMSALIAISFIGSRSA